MVSWDGVWYRDIAAHGYGWSGFIGSNKTASTTFFPGVPLVLRLGQLLTGSWVVSAVAMAASATVAASVLLYRVAARVSNEETARWALILWLAFPASFFLWQPFSDAMCTALVLWAVDSWQTGRYTQCSLATALAAMTRLTGVVAVPALCLAGARRGRHHGETGDDHGGRQPRSGEPVADAKEGGDQREEGGGLLPGRLGPAVPVGGDTPVPDPARVSDERTARWALLLWLAFPASFFLWQPYTGALTAALVMWSFDAWQRRRYTQSGIGAAFAATAHLTGAYAVPALCVAGYVRWRKGEADGRRAMLAPLSGLVGLAVVTGVQWWSAGKPSGWATSGGPWSRHVAPPWTGVVVFVRRGREMGGPWGTWVDLAMVGVAVAIIIAAWLRPWPLELRALLVVSVLVPLCSANLISFSRLMLGAWPGFIVAADLVVRMGRDRRGAFLGRALLAIEVLISLRLVQLWSQGVFVG